MVKKNTKENDMKRKTKGIMTAAIALVIIGSALLPREKVESIELSIPNYKPVYDINTDIPIDISVLPENAGTGSLNTFQMTIPLHFPVPEFPPETKRDLIRSMSYQEI